MRRAGPASPFPAAPRRAALQRERDDKGRPLPADLATAASGRAQLQRKGGNTTLPEEGGSEKTSSQLQPLPLSAVSLGLVPERSGDKTPTGADIALDALMEQEVAHSAQQFLKQSGQEQSR